MGERARGEEPSPEAAEAAAAAAGDETKQRGESLASRGGNGEGACFAAISPFTFSLLQ